MEQKAWGVPARGWEEPKPGPPTWDEFLRAVGAIRDQGFELVQVRTSLPGDGFELVSFTVREPAIRGGGI